MKDLSLIEESMIGFAKSTGLSTSAVFPSRYLWTDAFAVCNFVALFRLTGEEKWRQMAIRLVDQVHSILGKHRDDDPRDGWISGLPESEGKQHPTAGGLRIGKPLNERGLSDPFDERLEWERDGQYYHYLTKWMHALNRLSRVAGDPGYLSWALELAKSVHAGFVLALPSGQKRMYWKMSIDLTRPLIPSMGQHDPLDGLVTYLELQAAAESSGLSGVELSAEIADMTELCEGLHWATDDPLGIGGLLSDAHRVVLLIIIEKFPNTRLLEHLLLSSLQGLSDFAGGGTLGLPAQYRLGFRELGLAIGLHAVERIENELEKRPGVLTGRHPIYDSLKRLKKYSELGTAIEDFWLDPKNRSAQTWTEHLEINRVMLATRLAPNGYLGI